MIHHYKILIIDDEAMVIKGLKTLVPWDEISCTIVGTADNGADGLGMIEALKPDIVISDIRMPRLSGLEMIKALKNQNVGTKFIILSGYRDFEYARQAIDLGVTSFLLKPTNLEAIKQAVLQACMLLDDDREREEVIHELKTQLKDLKTHPEGSEPLEDSEKTISHLSTQALDFIRANYQEKLELQLVADALNISPWYLCKILKKDIGVSFIQLINTTRIDMAKQLLQDTNLKIYEIGERIGYQDMPYFTKIFKKYTGITPNAYRNQT